MKRLGIYGLWDNTIILKEVDCHIKLTTVGDGVGGKVVDEPVVDGKVGVLD